MCLEVECSHKCGSSKIAAQTARPACPLAGPACIAAARQELSGRPGPMSPADRCASVSTFVWTWQVLAQDPREEAEGARGPGRLPSRSRPCPSPSDLRVTTASSCAAIAPVSLTPKAHLEGVPALHVPPPRLECTAYEAMRVNERESCVIGQTGISQDPPRQTSGFSLCVLTAR